MADLLVDSSFLVAVMNPKDKHHQAALAFDKVDKRPRIIPDVVLPEVAHILKQLVGQYAVEQFLETVINSPMRVEPVHKEDLVRAHAIMVQYGDAKFDLVDCCIMALSERLDVTQICTFDRRDFSIFRSSHAEFLELLP